MALFEGTRESAIVRAYALDGFTVVRINKRHQLLTLAAELRPTLLLLPPFDEHGAPTAPLIARCRRELPDTAVALVVTDSIASGHQILAAARFGAAVMRITSRDDLRLALAPFFEGQQLTVAELHHIDTTILAYRDAWPDLTIEMLRAATRVAAHRDAISCVSQCLGISPRTLNRRSRAAGSPRPSELIAFVRLLRARVIAERGVPSLAAVARAAGFRSGSAYRAALLSHCPAFRRTHRAAKFSTAPVDMILDALDDRMRELRVGTATINAGVGGASSDVGISRP